jgi:hypothetical protein
MNPSGIYIAFGGCSKPEEVVGIPYKTEASDVISM